MAVRRQAASTGRRAANEAKDTVISRGRSFKEFCTKFYHDWSHHLTQALAFGIITSVVPLAMLILALVGTFIGKLDPHAQQQLTQQMGHILPQQLGSSSQDITATAFRKLPQTVSLLAIVGIITAVFFGSRLFTLLEACFDIIYRVPQRPFKNKNLTAIVMLILFMILTPLLVLASLVPEQLVALLRQTSIPTNANMLNRIAGIASSLIVSFILFEVIYAIVPNRRQLLQHRFRLSVPGAVTAAVVLQIALVLFPLYAQNYTSGFVGQLTFALIFFIFFYIVALVTLIGAEVNAYYSEGIRPTPHDLVKRLSQSE